MNKRIYECMDAAGMDALIVCRQDTVAYCTGFDTPLQYGATDNMANGAFTYAVADARNRKTTLIVIDGMYQAAKDAGFADETVYFESFDFFKHIDCRSSLEACLKNVISSLKGAKTIGIEDMALPVIAYKEILKTGAEIKNAADVLDESRKIKQPYEIERLKYVASIEDAGQLRLLEYAHNFNNETEIEVYTGVYRSMCEAHKKRVNLTGDFASGKRIHKLSGVYGPIERQIQRGELGIFDMSTRIDGYWCDCTNTVIFGAEPNAEQKKYYKMVREAFDAGLDKLVPGNTFRDVDAAMSAVFHAYGKEPAVYGGHQVGCNVNEVPRIHCFPTDIVQPDMVLCIEPQNYAWDEGDTGVRLERVVLITEQGPELLNKFPWGIDA